MNSSVERKTLLAICLMKRASPLPLDLETFLLAHGVDVAALDKLHRE